MEAVALTRDPALAENVVRIRSRERSAAREIEILQADGDRSGMRIVATTAR